MFIHNVVYSLSRFLSVNIGNIEALCIEFVNKKDKNVVINGHYGQNAGIYSEFEKYFKGLINETKNNAKDIYILDYIMNWKLRDYTKIDFQIAFQIFLIPMINKPTGVSKSNASVIDHRLTNSFF